MANKSSNTAAVPEAKGALDKFKYEVASELGVPLTDGYNGDLTSRQNGSVGGYMVKKMIEEQLIREKESGTLQIDDETVTRVIESIEPEDLKEAADIAEKYIEPENIGEYVDMVKDGNLSELEQQFKDQVTPDDMQKLQNLYEKYKDQIPQLGMP